MIGIGVVSHVLNVLPFAYFIISPFAHGRGNLPGNQSGAVYKDYYRKKWQKFFFGRHLKLTVSTLVIFNLVNNYRLGQYQDLRSWEFFAVFESLGGDYDEEYSSASKQALIKFKKEQLIKRNIASLAYSKALINYNKKAEVFDEYIASQN